MGEVTASLTKIELDRLASKENVFLSKDSMKWNFPSTVWSVFFKWGGIEPWFKTCGLYYKRVTIVIDIPSVVKVTLQIVASLTIVIDDAS